MRSRRKEEIACIIGIFLFALLVRTYAFTSLPRRAITDDAYEYNYIAQNISKALTGAQMEDKDTFLRYGASRGWLYPLFIAAVYKLFGNHPHYVMLLQTLLDAFTCILIYAIGKEIFCIKVGVAAALLAACYPAFPYYSTMLFQETTTIFLLTLFVLFLCRAISQKNPFLFFISGLLIVVVSFYRSGFLLFFLFTTPVLFFILWFLYKKDFLRPFLYFCTGALCMIILYGAFSYRLSASFTLNKPSIAWEIYETTHRDGWQSDKFAPTPTEALREVAQDYAYPLSADSHQLGLPPKIYLMATMRYIRNSPFGYLSQLITRCKRIWTYIETYPGRWHSKNVWGQLIFHRALIILALVGIPLSLTVWQYSALFVSIFLYITIAFTPIIGIPRYALPAMPFVIILAMHALFVIIDTVQHHGKRLFSLTYFPHLTATGILIITLCFVNVPNLLILFPHTSPALLYLATIISVNLFLFVIAYGGYVIFILHAHHRFRSLYIIALPLATVMVFFNNSAFTSKTWHEWEAPLSLPYQKVKQTIVLPEDFNPATYREAYVVIDMFPGGGQDYSFHVAVNGELVKSYHGGIKSKEGKFDKKFFGLYKSFFFDTYKLKPEDLRQWYEIDLPQHLLYNSPQLVIECSLGGIVDRSKNNVLLFGDYQTTGNRNLYIGPCIPRGDEDTSLPKIMPFSGDYRFEKTTLLGSKETTSAFYNGLEWQGSDLSSVRGIQSGSYRIRVKVIDEEGRQVIL